MALRAGRLRQGGRSGDLPRPAGAARRADVNLLLFALWSAGVCGHDLTDQEIGSARVRDWTAGVVIPLRAVRNLRKPPLPPVPDEPRLRLRNRVKEVELAAERIAPAVLHRRLAIAPATGADPRHAAAFAAHNLLRVLGPAPAAAVAADLRAAVVPVAAAVPAANAAAVERAVQAAAGNAGWPSGA